MIEERGNISIKKCEKWLTSLLDSVAVQQHLPVGSVVAYARSKRLRVDISAAVPCARGFLGKFAKMNNGAPT